MSDLHPRDSEASSEPEAAPEPELVLESNEDRADSEPVGDEEANPDAPTITTEPTDWFEPPPVEAVTVEAESPTAPDDYVPPTNDQTGFVSAQTDARPMKFGEITVDLVDLDGDQRRLLSYRLTELGVTHRVENDGLVASTESMSAIHGQMAELFGSEDVEEVIEEADDDEDEIVFDLSSLSTEERRHLGMRLTGAGISYIWEVGTDLVVSVEDAAAIESYVEEVRNPDGFGDEEIASLEEDSDIDDEVIYGAMSNLYVAADKLMQRPGDDPTAGEFYLAADDVDGLPAPFGFDPRVWSQVLALTATICDALDAEAADDTIGASARQLREILVNYV